jgi:predicted Abi (CAAX) family protease
MHAGPSVVDAELYLVMRRLSPGGIGVLALVSLALLGPTLTSGFVGFDPAAAFLLAPANAIAQELYFRAALLPVMHRALAGRPGMANLSHAALFALWHVPKAIIFSPINPLLGAGMLALVTGLVGFGWGWQVRHDGTIAWSTLHHWVLLAVMSLFGL